MEFVRSSLRTSVEKQWGNQSEKAGDAWGGKDANEEGLGQRDKTLPIRDSS